MIWPARGNAQCDFHHAAARSIPITKHERGPGASGGDIMSITGTRGQARRRNLSSGAVFFPKEEKEAAPVDSRRCRHLAVSYRFWGGILDGAVPCDSGLDHPASLVQVRRQAETPARFPRTKRLPLEATTGLTILSKVGSKQRKPQSLAPATRTKMFRRQCGRPNAALLTPFQGCGSYSPSRLLCDADTPQTSPHPWGDCLFVGVPERQAPVSSQSEIKMIAQGLIGAHGRRGDAATVASGGGKPRGTQHKSATP